MQYMCTRNVNGRENGFMSKCNINIGLVNIHMLTFEPGQYTNWHRRSSFTSYFY